MVYPYKAGGAANDLPASFNLPLTLPSGEAWPDLGAETDSGAPPYALRVCASTPGLPNVCSTTSVFGIRRLRRFVAVTQPDSSSVWSAGQAVTVRWASSSIPSTATVSIALMSYRYELQGGDVQLASIGAGLPVLNGLSVPWTVPANLPSTSPVYIKVLVDGQGVWGRSPVFLLKSAPLPVLSEFLSAACPRDSSQPGLEGTFWRHTHLHIDRTATPPPTIKPGHHPDATTRRVGRSMTYFPRYRPATCGGSALG